MLITQMLITPVGFLEIFHFFGTGFIWWNTQPLSYKMLTQLCDSVWQTKTNLIHQWCTIKVLPAPIVYWTWRIICRIWTFKSKINFKRKYFIQSSPIVRIQNILQKIISIFQMCPVSIQGPSFLVYGFPKWRQYYTGKMILRQSRYAFTSQSTK